MDHYFDRLYFDLRSSQRFPDSNFVSNLVNVFRDFKTMKKKGGGVEGGGVWSNIEGWKRESAFKPDFPESWLSNDFKAKIFNKKK